MGWDEVACAVAGSRERFLAQTRDARQTQEGLLKRILAANADGPFGRQYGFAQLRGLAAYARTVPATDDATLAPAALCEPVVAYERTGGSTGGAKLIPFTVSGLADLRSGLYAWLDDLLEQRPAIRAGRSYWSISPATRAPESTPEGVPIGMPSDAAYFGEAAYAIASVLAVPPEVGGIPEVDAWRRATLRALLTDDTLSLVSVWSPTFWLELCRHAVADRSALVAGLDPARARTVAAALAADPPDWRAIWPRLALVSCWTHASAAPWAAQLASAFPAVEVQGKGLLATEGLLSIPWCDGGDPVAAVASTVLEFEDDAGRAWPGDEVEMGGEYAVLMTTAAGLYRYRLGDRVRVTGRLGQAPRFVLLGRGGAASDLCGEKLTEAFVLHCWQGVGLGAGRLVPAPQPRPHYQLWLPPDATDADAAARALDEALHANPQYAYARKIGQLAPLAPRRVADLAGRMQQAALARGQRLGDAKPSVLGRVDEALP
jgi:hypothetical protein